MATQVTETHGAGGPGGAAGRDAALVAGLRAGRRDAFERLYERYRGRIYNLTLRIVRSHEDACDITQDVFIKAFRKLPDSPVADLHLTPWLFRVAVNASYDHLRTRRVHRDIHEAGVESRAALVDTFEQAEMGRRVEQTLGALSERHRTALVLKDIHGLRHDEIAEILGISRNAAETLLFRARDAFRVKYLEFTHDRAGARNAEKWSAAGIGIGMFLHELPLPAALQGGFPFGAAGAGGAAMATATAGTAASGAGSAATGAGTAAAIGTAAGSAGGASTGVSLATGGLLAKLGGAATAKLAAVVAAAACAAGGGVTAYEAGMLPGLHPEPPAHAAAAPQYAGTAASSHAAAVAATKAGASSPAPGAAVGAAAHARAAVKKAVHVRPKRDGRKADAKAAKATAKADARAARAAAKAAKADAKADAAVAKADARADRAATRAATNGAGAATGSARASSAAGAAGVPGVPGQGDTDPDQPGTPGEGG